MEKDLLDCFPFYLVFNDKFVESALKNGKYNYHQLPWAMREKYLEMHKAYEKANEREDGLPFNCTTDHCHFMLQRIALAL